MPNVHTLDIYPHTGPRSCIGCIWVPDSPGATGSTALPPPSGPTTTTAPPSSAYSNSTAAEPPPVIDEVAFAAPPRFRIRTSGSEDDAVRRPFLASCAEEGVYFVRPDVSLDPPLRVIAWGKRLRGRSARCELRVAGKTVASVTVDARQDTRVEFSFARVPASVFGNQRVVRVSARATAGPARADTRKSPTLVKMRELQVDLTGADREVPTQASWDLAYALIALGTPAQAPLTGVSVSSMRRRPERQLAILADFGRQFGIAGAGAMVLSRPATWVPVLNAVRRRGIAIAAPATVTYGGVQYYASSHIDGTAVDFTPYVGGVSARVAAICRFHGATPEVIPEPRNNAIHVEV